MNRRPLNEVLTIKYAFELGFAAPAAIILTERNGIDMINLRLIAPVKSDESEFNDMMREWSSADENIYPAVFTRYKPSFDDFLTHLNKCRSSTGLAENVVPNTTLILRDDAGRIYGGVTIRHYLNAHLNNYGGHIGMGIRPSERGKGYELHMFRLAVIRARELGISKLLITYEKDNLIMDEIMCAVGALYDSTVYSESVEKEIDRYWLAT